LDFCAGLFRLGTVSAHVTLDALADVESDLLARFDIVGGATDGGSDFVVLLGLVNAGRAGSAGSEPSRRELLCADPALAVDGWGIDVSDFDLFQQLWYRLRVPFGTAPLYWWYLVTLALRDPDRPIADAAEALTTLVEQLSVSDAAERAAICSRAPDGRAGEVVVATGDLLDTDPLVEAVIRDVPLVVVAGEAEIADLRRRGWAVVDHARTAAPVVTHEMSGLAHTAGGREPELADLTARTRAAWTGLDADERTLTLTRLQQRFSALEQLRFCCGGDVSENADIVALIGSCRTVPPPDWSYDQLVYATLALCWERGGFIVQEFNHALLTLPLMAVFLSRRIAEYGAITGRFAELPRDLVDAAGELGRLRAELERTHLRCIQFDGSNWERREFVVAKALRDDFVWIPDSLADLMASRFGVEIADRSGSGAAWDAYLECILGEGRTPTQLMCAVVDWAANDDLLPIDAAIFTVPHGIKLESPWELEIDDVFCYTAFRDGFDPRDHGMPLDLTGMRNAIGQRMRYNVVKKAQNYALVKRFKPQSFNLPDIAVAEDANHAGHRAGGIRLSMRLPTRISYRGDEWKGIADVRCNRGGYHPDNRFRPSDVILGSRYVAWEKGIADATFARGLLFDHRFCVKLTEPTEAQIEA
jgi:hypothetical protein